MRMVLVLAGVAAVLATATDASSSRKFVSKTYGYSIVLAAGWTSSPASTHWKGGPPFQDEPEVDLHLAADGRMLAVAALSLPRTTTLKQWAASYVRAAIPSFCTKSRGFRTTTLGDAPAVAFTGHCEIHDIDVALTVHRGRGYVFALAAPSTYSAADDGHVFETARRSFRFLP